MGGNAFAAELSDSAFPRLPPAVYVALKSRLVPALDALYSHVTVPIEAPEKPNYGDLDILVYLPKRIGEEATVHMSASTTPAVTPGIVGQAIGARYSNLMDGNRTSNYAVPIEPGAWALLGCELDEQEGRKHAPGGAIFYQVQVFHYDAANFH